MKLINLFILCTVLCSCNDTNQVVNQKPASVVKPVDPVKAHSPAVAPNDAKISIKTVNGNLTFNGRIGRDMPANLLAVSMQRQCQEAGQVFDKIQEIPQQDGTKIIMANCR